MGGADSLAWRWAGNIRSFVRVLADPLCHTIPRPPGPLRGRGRGRVTQGPRRASRSDAGTVPVDPRRGPTGFLQDINNCDLDRCVTGDGVAFLSRFV